MAMGLLAAQGCGRIGFDLLERPQGHCGSLCADDSGPGAIDQDGGPIEVGDAHDLDGASDPGAADASVSDGTVSDASASDAGGQDKGSPATDGSVQNATDAGSDAGVGEPTCTSGWDDCDGSPENGCEVFLGSEDDCGMCGRACDAGTWCSEGVCGSQCDLTGTFALHIPVQVAWPRRGAVESGSGDFEWWFRVETQRSDSVHADARVTLCGVTVPEQSAWAVSETWRYRYDDSVFDGGSSSVGFGEIAVSGTTVGSGFTLPNVALLLGIDLADPLGDVWPSSASSVLPSSPVDADGDGQPAVTADFMEGGGLVFPRASSLESGFSRADRVYLASRVLFALSGNWDDCNAVSGHANFPAIETRVVGCSRAVGGDCTAAEAAHLDDSVTRFTANNTRFGLRRLAGGASCAAVRAELP